jgi:NTP pyrophosphatase (non-canonical NTP hydrolase)
MALIVECSELAEHFQWLSPQQSKRLTRETYSKVQEEIADVFLYLLRLADVLEIDLVKAAEEKLRINELKYPANMVRGSARKYTEYK